MQKSLKIGNRVQQKYGFKKIGTVVEIRENKNLSTEVVYQIKFKDKSTQMTDGRSFNFIRG